MIYFFDGSKEAFLTAFLLAYRDGEALLTAGEKQLSELMKKLGELETAAAARRAEEEEKRRADEARAAEEAAARAKAEAEAAAKAAEAAKAKLK